MCFAMGVVEAFGHCFIPQTGQLRECSLFKAREGVVNQMGWQKFCNLFS